MKKITNIVLAIAGVVSFIAACVVIMDVQGRKMDAYAAEHNCRWDYNDLCYTQEEKPWLFK